MKKNLVILGSGPRGLASAIQAIQYKDKFNIYVVDPQPVSTWKFPNMVVDMKMRSPITFDLVTYFKDLEEFSLTKFLNKTANKNTQKTIEANNIFCSRSEFVDYLNNCIQLLVKEGVTFIKRIPSLITKQTIEFNNTILKFDYLIIATGKGTEDPIIPNYLKSLATCFCDDMYRTDWNSKIIYVVGSGQFSAEIIDYLTDNIRATIYWVRKHDIKTEQYPAPSFKEWKKFSALSTYYHQNKDIQINGIDYIKLVKKWGPTLTPHITNKLYNKKNKYGIITSKQMKLNKNNIYLLALGRKQNLYKLPFNFRFPNAVYTEKCPLVTKEFNTYKHPHIYFTGLLALESGGPQQGSVISSAYTGDIILKSILSSF